jgi:uncharacterized protein (DUF362 family)
MEGDGPLNGTPKKLDTIVLSDDPVAADFLLAELLGSNPIVTKHLEEASRFLGNRQATHL